MNINLTTSTGLINMGILKINGVSNGWVRYTSTNEEAKSLKDTGLLTDKFRPRFGGSCVVWLPRWVRDAVRIFNKEGFAGMTLTEYLLAIKPEEAKKD